MKKGYNLTGCTHTHTHTSNFTKKQKAEEALFKIEKKTDYQFISIKLKSKINK